MCVCVCVCVCVLVPLGVYKALCAFSGADPGILKGGGGGGGGRHQ